MLYYLYAEVVYDFGSVAVRYSAVCSPRNKANDMTLAMMAMVWYVPGWLRTQTPQEGCLESLTNTYETAEVQFKAWNGDIPIWPKAVEHADLAADRIAAEVIAMPEVSRTNLTIVGHSLGGRITARVLARLAEKNLKVRQAVLMAAAIPFVDADIAKMGGGSELPVISVCNPDDVTLKYVYALAGGEPKAGYLAGAYGANGSVTNIPNVIEYVTPTNITESVKIDHLWGRSEHLKEIANHHVHFYLEYLRKIVNGEAGGGRVMVPQHLPTVEGKVMDAGIWWRVLDTHAGWKLERNLVTGHCRILDPQKTRRAWGGESEMRAAFAKTKAQLK